ncbi:adenylosuccinate synthase [Mesoterricola sediminis]|uniref:Adenylosuccinate synthetase n=1 Tax=Mesoterricola sediminis TaxID=2927980 RepID=A0AA48KAR8_9BACT|nr:adenylosuccinate synthase [Mesoterricola sediminis]BDU75349.1 adenylosuccinate synthetase [Mesoterricola sediminis]
MRGLSENLAILGLQWGDEGKGKLVDLLSARFKNVVRFQGGNNAGHTVVVEGQSIALHQVPSGALHPGCFLVVGSGVVLNLEVFLQELDRLRQRGFELTGRLLISDKAHIILPHHIALDRWREGGSNKIGTTGRGIGPAYEMKAARMGVRMGDLLHPETLQARISHGYQEVRHLLGPDAPLASLEETAAALLATAQPLLGMIGDIQDHLWQAWRRGESILFEGAQATLLDIDHGTYPFVTSSNCSIGGLFTGTGLPPKALSHVLGVAKAYTTRVGAGPMPSELLDATGDRIRDLGREFGTTTGRPRRCGWFDSVITRHACRVNGVDGLGLMKLDVLDGFDQVGLVVGYRDGEGRVTGRVPAMVEDWKEIQPEIKYFKGWTAPTRGIQDPAKLPAEAQVYLRALEESVETPIAYLSTGPDRVEGYVAPGSFLEPLLS